jgi:hypothetical protein
MSIVFWFVGLVLVNHGMYIVDRAFGHIVYQ